LGLDTKSKVKMQET